MTSRRLLEALSAELLNIEIDSPEDVVDSRYRDLSSDWHPDVSDHELAQERFAALGDAVEILTGGFPFYDADQPTFARNRLERVMDDDVVEGVVSEYEHREEFSSPGGSRRDPSGFNVNDFMGATREERSHMASDISLGVEALLIYGSVSNLFEQGYTRSDYFDDVNGHIAESDISNVSFEDYWDAVGDNIRDDSSKSTFINSIEVMQGNLQSEFVGGTTIREISTTIAYFIINGSATMGDVERFVGGGVFGGGDVFGGSGPFSGSGHMGGGSSTFQARRNRRRGRGRGGSRSPFD